jgi:acyl-CoA thioester hydrolase
VKARRGLYSARVLYQDTDQARVVHHAAYFRFLEAGRLELWRDNGFSYDAFEKETGLGLPVAEAHMRYRAGGKFDDLIVVETWASVATRASVWFDAVIRRSETVLVESRVRLACASLSDGSIRKIPVALLDACLEPEHGV